MLRKILIGLIFSVQFISCSDKNDSPVDEEVFSDLEEKKEQQENLGKPPLESQPYKFLSDLNSFQNPGDNWIEVGEVTSDFNKKQDIHPKDGKGILLNTNDKSKNSHLISKLKHNDMELDFEFMIPKGSNSGVYFQGRYEIQLLDSWGVKNPKHSDLGGIYQRWEETRGKGNEGYEGIPPSENAAKAPGLWQHFNIIFKAPRFDVEGNKIANAEFKKVTLNGIVIHKNKEVTGPTRAAKFANETSEKAPLIFQGDHGPVAFRNIKYKLHDYKTSVTNISYTYHKGQFKNAEAIGDSPVVKEGTTRGFYNDSIKDEQYNYGIKFKGTLNIPVSGEYIFYTKSSWGSQIYIDDKLVLDNDHQWGFKHKAAKVKLTEGQHNFKLDYYHGRWGLSGLSVLVEGPDSQLTTLESLPNSMGKPDNPILIDPQKNTPRIQRGFVMFGKDKKTHTINVGYPSKINYTIEPLTGSLLQFWRGDFGDVTDMWHSRGHEQLFKPTGNVILYNNQEVIKILENNNGWDKGENLDRKFEGYRLDKNGEPVFLYSMDQMHFEDKILVGDNQLTREISTQNIKRNTYFKVTSAKTITKIEENLYSINGDYFIEIPENSEYSIAETEKGKEIIMPLTRTLKYSIIW